MVDPRIVLILLAIYGAIWVSQHVTDAAKHLGHQTKCGVMRVVGKHCAPYVPPVHEPIDLGEIQ